jgi:hypothetical protein
LHQTESAVVIALTQIHRHTLGCIKRIPDTHR